MLSRVGTTLETGEAVTICPNLDDWRVGDVLLSSQDKSRAGGAAVKAYQWMIRHSNRGWRWTHVAVYAEQGLFFDARPKDDIKPRVAADLLRPGYDYLLMRPRISCPDWEEFQDNCLKSSALGAYRALGKDVRTLYTRRLAQSWRGRTDPLPEPDGEVLRRTTCAMFAARMLELASDHPGFAMAPATTPADFTDPDWFDPVPVAWRRPPDQGAEKPLAA